MRWFGGGRRRRERKTTSDRIAPWLMAIFGLACAGLVIAYAYAAAKDRLLLYRVRHAYVQTTCTVFGRELRTDLTTKTVRRLRRGHTHKVVVYLPEVRYRYSVEGREHVGTAVSPLSRPTPDREAADAVLARYEVGKEYPCWYDPDRPGDAFLERP